MSKYLDSNGLLYFWQKIKAAMPKKTSDLTNDSGFITSGDVPDGAAASTTTPVMSGTAATGTETTFARGDHVHPSDTTKVDKVTGKGLSANDYTTAEKEKLSGIAAGANAYTHPSQTANAAALRKMGNDASGHVVAGDAVTKADITGLGIPAQDTTYSAVTTSANGLMTKEDKAKLNAFGAASTYALKSDITAMYKYKGSKATYALLPASGNTVGDVWNVEADGMNYAWDGTVWDAMGASFTITAITNSEIDTIVAS